ncbi:TfoX/Sxy family transcriptional regulator of competence genes [Xanthomonas translucens]
MVVPRNASSGRTGTAAAPMRVRPAARTGIGVAKQALGHAARSGAAGACALPAAVQNPASTQAQSDAMASDASYVDYVMEQAALGAALTCKKMFGEYALYLDGKVVAFVCDNQVFVKPTDAGRALLDEVVEQAPYPGGKPHYLIDEGLEDRSLLQRLLRATAQALPAPKPGKAAKRAGKPPAAR